MNENPKINGFPSHRVFKFGDRGFYWAFDTFRTPAGNDKAICNFIRLIALFGFLFVMIANMNWILQILLIAICMGAVGITKVRYAQNDWKAFEWEAW